MYILVNTCYNTMSSLKHADGKDKNVLRCILITIVTTEQLSFTKQLNVPTFYPMKLISIHQYSVSEKRFCEKNQVVETESTVLYYVWSVFVNECKIYIFTISNYTGDIIYIHFFKYKLEIY